MSYDNAEPKILKTLNSSGQVLNDLGEVISDTSDYWVQLYNQTEPKVDKILHSDGTIKDAAGNLIQNTTEFNVRKYNQAEPMPAKYLHSDGTINENSGSGGGADLEDNHQTSINVSTYTEPVEVLPISGKDGMKKNTITLNNIPSGGDNVTFYAWRDNGIPYFTVSENPSVGDYLYPRTDDDHGIDFEGTVEVVSSVGNNTVTFIIYDDEGEVIEEVVLSRSSAYDVTFVKSSS